MPEFKIGDRVKVAQLIKDEPCSDIDVLLDQVGTVMDPAVDDTDYDGNPTKRVQVRLDKPVDLAPFPKEDSNEFVFKPEELEAL